MLQDKGCVVDRSRVHRLTEGDSELTVDRNTRGSIRRDGGTDGGWSGDQDTFAAGGGFAPHNGILDISSSDSVCSLTRAVNAVRSSHCLKVSSSLGFETTLTALHQTTNLKAGACLIINLNTSQAKITRAVLLGRGI